MWSGKEGGHLDRHVQTKRAEGEREGEMGGEMEASALDKKKQLYLTFVAFIRKAPSCIQQLSFLLLSSQP